MEFARGKVAEAVSAPFFHHYHLWLIIITADHGEELYDHHKFFYHSPSLYDSALRIPLLIKFPRQRGRRVVDENVSLIDILPTIQHYYAGLPDSGRYSGMSLLELLNGRRAPFRERVFYAEADDLKIVAAVKGGFKLIYNPSGKMSFTHLGLPFPIETMEFFRRAAGPWGNPKSRRTRPSGPSEIAQRSRPVPANCRDPERRGEQVRSKILSAILTTVSLIDGFFLQGYTALRTRDLGRGRHERETR